MSVLVGTSGWSYPSWRPGFYPPGIAPGDFLRFYASRFETVELNTTGYRLPAAEQFARWAEAVPDGFRFAPKLTLGRLDRLVLLLDHLAALGDRLGPLRLVVERPRDDSLLAAVLEAVPAATLLAFDFRHDSWAGTDTVVKVNDPAAMPFRYLRLREPPYSEEQLGRLAASIHPPAYVYFRHEDEPSAPAYARRLRELLSA